MMGEYSRLAKGLASILAEEIHSAKEERNEEIKEDSSEAEEEIMEFSAGDDSPEKKENDEEILEFIPDEEEGGVEK